MATNNAVNITSAGLVRYNGTGTFSGVTVTDHNLLIGAASNGITSVAPSATIGIPVISQGAAADPAFGTAVVAGGGTGIVTATAYAPIVGGTTATGAFQSADTGIATAGFVLTSTGASSLPTFQVAPGSTAIQTITGSSGGAQSPSAGNFNILGSGSITTVGTANTETISLTGLTQYNVLVGAGSDTITKVAPSATSGVPLISQGSSANPSFGTAVVAGGGTGRATLTDHGVLIGAGTTAITQSSVGATGTVFIGNTGADPSFSATPAVTSIALGGGTALANYVVSTFTPTLTFGGGSTGITYTTREGNYTRIGNIVNFCVNITLSSKGSSTGSAQMSVPINNAGGALGGIFITQQGGITLDATYQVVTGVIQSNSIQFQETGTGLAPSALTNSHFSNTSILFFTGTYFA